MTISKHSSAFSDLTIVLILFNRDDFARRWLNYFHFANVKISLIIADGGSKPFIPKAAQTVLPENVVYNYYGLDKDIPTMVRKVFSALTQVKTEYVLLSSDDDFYLFEGLDKTLKKLRARPDIHACMGLVKDFAVIPSRVNPSITYGHIRFGDSLYGAESIDNENSIERSRAFLVQNESFWHAIYRTKTLRNAYKCGNDMNLSDYSFYEFFINLKTSLAGKLARDSFFYLLHQNHARSEAKTIKSLEKNEFFWRARWEELKAGKYGADFQNEKFPNFEGFLALRNSKIDTKKYSFLRIQIERIKFKFGHTFLIYIFNHADPFVAKLYLNREVRQIIKFMKLER